jgi:predicted RNA-binding protein with PUA-like domain
MMAYFLAKTDPETYTIDQLEKDKQTQWDGVTNAQAVAVIKTMRPGDKVFIYHSMGQSAIVGMAKVIAAPVQDPNQPKSYTAGFQFVRRLEPPTTLAEVKQCHLFDTWTLVRQSRLSTMAVPEEFVEWMRLRYPKAKI